MRPRSTFALLAIAVVLAVGMIDAALGSVWDLVLVFALAMILQVVLFLRLRLGRHETSLRPDLARWIEERALATGEDPDVLTDRCVAAYRAGLTGVGGSDGP